MTEVLGYRRFGAQGGDWGSFITSRLAYSYRLVGIHLNMMLSSRQYRDCRADGVLRVSWRKQIVEPLAAFARNASTGR
jgi:hypothetical protein